MNVIVDGRKMELDVRRARELGVLKPLVPHKVGNYYAHSSGLYILACVGLFPNGKVQMMLVNLRNGIRKTDPVEASNPLSLSPIEWEAVCNGSPEQMRYIPNLKIEDPELDNQSAIHIITQPYE